MGNINMASFLRPASLARRMMCVLVEPLAVTSQVTQRTAFYEGAGKKTHG